VNDDETTENKELKEKEKEQLQRIDEFLTLWLKYITIQNAQHFFNEYLIGKGYSGMIDLKPSIIKS